eukprot:CAMPEP_0202905206 /NCGR_PEP_ID=MMETSP1392-20130828/33068_1 /ASSEMBLY_ACC=CAM_ASM_000868 /TAXON_ID=225041 /ORGANISM="Chlamydomonas chlamydogama, Strain SAG 11-48b" /LENGTH=160 /DNA_ID=CAMNT_0049593185 /DNA_START=39 /DNA_END=521 /DNA_ORIENTATION=+
MRVLWNEPVENLLDVLGTEEFQEAMHYGKYTRWFLYEEPSMLYNFCQGLRLLAAEPDSPLVAWARNGGHGPVTFTPTQKKGIELLRTPDTCVEEDVELLSMLKTPRKLYAVIWEAGGLRCRVDSDLIEQGSTADWHDRAVSCLCMLVKFAIGEEEWPAYY